MCVLLFEGDSFKCCFTHFSLTLSRILSPNLRMVQHILQAKLVGKMIYLDSHFQSSRLIKLTSLQTKCLLICNSNWGEKEICPILAFGIYLLSFPGIFKGRRMLEGTRQSLNFSKSLKIVVKMHCTLQDQEQKNEIDPIFCKGSCSYAAGDIIVAPPMMLICLWVMWSISYVEEKYLKYDEARNQCLGGVVSGMKSDSKNCSIFLVLLASTSKSKKCRTWCTVEFLGILFLQFCNMVNHIHLSFSCPWCLASRRCLVLYPSLYSLK